MLRLRNTGIILLFILLFSLRFFAVPADPESWKDTNISRTEANKSNPFSEFHNPYPPCDYAIEIRSFSENISEVFRFTANQVLPNQIVPINFFISGTIFIPVTFNYNSPVSIFIRGHAFLC